MGIRTAPTVDGTSFTNYYVSFRLIDTNARKRSIVYASPDGLPFAVADVEALAVATQNATNASLWGVQVVEAYEGVASSANADGQAVESVFDNVVINVREDAGNEQLSAFIPAPLTQMVIGGRVDPLQAQYIAYRDALLALYPGFSAVGARFSQRSRKGTSGPAIG